MTLRQRVWTWWRLRLGGQAFEIVVTPYVVGPAKLRPGWRVETKPDIVSWDRSTWPSAAERLELAARRERAKAYLRSRGVAERPGLWPWGEK